MKTELIVALIAGVVASASAVGTFWSSRRTNFNALAIKRLEIDNEASKLWGTDAYPPVLRIFTGEQRALGDALIQTDEKGLQLSECIGYGTFLKTFAPSTNPLIDALRTDFAALSINGVGAASERLKAVQNALIDLLLMLDPGYIRFPEDRRSKA